MNHRLYEEYKELQGSLDVALQTLTATKQRVYAIRSSMRDVQIRRMANWREKPLPAILDNAEFWNDPDNWNDE